MSFSLASAAHPEERTPVGREKRRRISRSITNPMTEKIRIEEVARLAGVSPTTVSRVINKIPTVTEANRLKVEEAIQHLNFKPNVLAQRLAKGKNDTIALVIPRYEGIFFSFYANQIIRGVGVAAENLKLDLLLHLSTGRDTVNTMVTGGILFADIIGNLPSLKSALQAQMPCVVLNYFMDEPEVNCISIDNATGAQQAVEYLIHLGHQNIAHITGDLKSQSAQQRLEGYKKTLAKHDVRLKEELFIHEGDYSRPSARKAMMSLLASKVRPSAVFCASDDMAEEAIAVILEHGLKVPDDISLIGFDDNPLCLYGSVSLTTIRQPLIEMAAEATSLLHKIMSSKTTPPPTKITLPTQLIIRDSCRQM